MQLNKKYKLRICLECLNEVDLEDVDNGKPIFRCEKCNKLLAEQETKVILVTPIKKYFLKPTRNSGKSKRKVINGKHCFMVEGAVKKRKSL